MCRSCDKPSRRRVLSFLVTGAVAACLLGAGAPRRPDTGATTMTTDEALAKLKAGNQRFLTAPELCAADMAKQRADAATAPFLSTSNRHATDVTPVWEPLLDPQWTDMVSPKWSDRLAIPRLSVQYVGMRGETGYR
jgi:hypothetical protein